MQGNRHASGDADGLVSEQTGTASTADKSKRNYFAVHWDEGVFPTPADGCARIWI